MQELPPGFVYSPVGQLARSTCTSRSCDCLIRSKVFPWFFSVPEQMLSSHPKFTFHCMLLMQSSQFSYHAAVQRQNSAEMPDFFRLLPQQPAYHHLIFFSSQHSTLPQAHLPEGRAGIAWQPSE